MKLFFILTILLSNLLFANTYKSGDNKVSLLELYTSQGCSSCPSADRWLSSLKKEKTLFKKFIPLAFHVTYWDFLGWRDSFANIANDKRQKKYSRDIWKKNSVYTPQFIVDSKEYRRWFQTQDLPTFKNEYAGKLDINLDKKNNLIINYYNKNIKKKDILIHIVISGFNYSIPIKNGENAHKILKHDFVVLQHIKKASKININTLEYKTKIYPKHTRSENSKNKQAIVVWISDKNYNQLQAVGGYL